MTSRYGKAPVRARSKLLTSSTEVTTDPEESTSAAGCTKLSIYLIDLSYVCALFKICKMGFGEEGKWEDTFHCFVFGL